jgi:hypothetical protein
VSTLEGKAHSAKMSLASLQDDLPPATSSLGGAAAADGPGAGVTPPRETSESRCVTRSQF